MTTYTTQMDAARKGIVTPQIKTVAEKEHMPVEKMMELVAEGKVAICANALPIYLLCSISFKSHLLDKE